MGTYFLMSTRFNKKSPEDFGLIRFEGTKTAINPADNSIWIQCSLYDLGWGAENGFYRSPLPGYKKLFEIVSNSCDCEDVYGAAAIILEKYPLELLGTCEELVAKKCGNISHLNSIFKLQAGINRCPIIEKSSDEISNYAYRWHQLAQEVTTLLDSSCMERNDAKGTQRKKWWQVFK